MVDRTHPFTSGDGSVRQYVLVLDEEKCPECNPHGMRDNGVYGVLSHTNGTTTLECLNCAHSANRDANEIEFRYPEVVAAAAAVKMKEV